MRFGTGLRAESRWAFIVPGRWAESRWALLLMGGKALNSYTLCILIEGLNADVYVYKAKGPKAECAFLVLGSGPNTDGRLYYRADGPKAVGRYY